MAPPRPAAAGPIAGIVFDKDGTLLDYAATWGPVNRLAAERAAGGPGPLADRLLEAGGWEAATGRFRHGSLLAAGHAGEVAAHWHGLLAGRGPYRDAAALTRAIDAAFLEGGLAHAAPVTDLAALFGRLRGRGLQLGIATSDSEAAARATAEKFDLIDHLAFIAGYDSGHGVKPGPGMVRGFCAATGLPPAAVLVVGDNTHDLDMGRSAGAGRVVGVLTGTGTPDSLAAADHIADSIADLEALLNRWA